MDLVRPSLLRSLALVAVVLAVVSLPASAASAHDGTGGASSDYRISIVGYDGDPTGVQLRVVELGNRVELTMSGASEVFVLGYDGEMYLRFDADGVWENVDSPAHYLNADRYAATQPPDGLSAQSPPRWELRSTGSSYRWHDHRAHWMSPVPPQVVTEEPDVERLVRTDRVELQIDGRAVAADVEIIWLPTPNRTIWLLAASVFGAAVTAMIVLLPSARRAVPALSLVAAIVSTLGQGDSTARLLIGAIAIAAAVLGCVVRRWALAVIPVSAALAAGILAATRLEVFEHRLLAGLVSADQQRASIVIALALVLGIVASTVVTALSPTPSADQGSPS